MSRSRGDRDGWQSRRWALQLSGKIAAQARRDIDKLHGHFANFLAGERIEFRVEVVTPVDGLEDGFEELCRRDVISAFERKLRRGWPHHEIRLADDLDC
jgi:hypothetical protein